MASKWPCSCHYKYSGMQAHRPFQYNNCLGSTESTCVPTEAHPSIESQLQLDHIMTSLRSNLWLQLICRQMSLA
eukprot:10305029-Prorocentrum_lima.AAC.1